jgi:hypothetical protein
MEIDNLNITLISCNKNVVYRGITQTLLLEAFSDLADGLSSFNEEASMILWYFNGVQFARSLVFCLVFCRSLFVLVPFSLS